MFPEFRRRFPRAALISELLQIDHGKYIVLVRVESEGRILATGLAAADTIETAEDRARERAIALLTAETEEIPPIVPPLPVAEIVKPAQKETPQVAIAPVAEIAKPTQKEPPQETSPLPEIPTPEPTPGATPKKATKTPKNPPVAPPEPEPVVKMPEPEPESFAAEIEEDNYSLYPDNGLRAIEEEPEPPAPPLPVEEIDYSVLKTKIDVEMKRLGWTMEKGRDYLISTYGKKSRLLLTNEELLEFYNHLSSI